MAGRRSQRVEFGGWTPIAAAQTTSGYEVAWSIPGADQYTIWYTDSSGNYLSSAFNSASGSSTQLESFEASFNDDLNSDGTIGVPPPPARTVIESSGTMSLLTDGTNYFLQPNGGSAVELSYGGAPVFAGEFAQFGYDAPIAAAQTASGYEVAWSIPGADQYQIWTTDSSGNEVSIPFAGSGAQVESYEASFNDDLNGDGTIGINASPPPQFVYEGTDANGAQVYDITNAVGSEPIAVRVLTPQHPSTDYPHSFLYALPVEGGLAQSTYGSGLDELANLDVEDQYNATIIEPIFPMNSWYADNPNDPTINYETFVADILPQWVDSNFSTTGTEQNLLVGFSKSGYGALDLELKHPSVFSAVAAFDFPGDMTSYDYDGSSSANDYGTQANFQDNYEMNASFIGAHDASFTTQDRILISEGPALTDPSHRLWQPAYFAGRHVYVLEPDERRTYLGWRLAVRRHSGALWPGAELELRSKRLSERPPKPLGAQATVYSDSGTGLSRADVSPGRSRRPERSRPALWRCVAPAFQSSPGIANEPRGSSRNRVSERRRVGADGCFLSAVIIAKDLARHASCIRIGRRLRGPATVIPCLLWQLQVNRRPHN